MSRLKRAKLSSMPLPFTALKMHPLPDNRVTQLMVEDGSYPPTCGGLKELPRHDDPSSSNITRGEYPLLRAAAPGDHIGIELRAIGIVLAS